MILRWVAYAQQDNNKEGSDEKTSVFSGSINTLIIACIFSWTRLLNAFAISHNLVCSSSFHFSSLFVSFSYYSFFTGTFVFHDYSTVQGHFRMDLRVCDFCCWFPGTSFISSIDVIIIRKININILIARFHLDHSST